MVTLGVPYSPAEIANAPQALEMQAIKIESNLMKDADIQKSFGNETENPLKDREIIALIAYLQRLGTDTAAKPKP